jgi:hypothetical protein
MTIFRSNYFHLKLSYFNIFLNNCYIYANVFKIFKFELNPLDNKKDIGHYVLFRTFHDNFQVKLFPPKIIFFNFFLNIRYIYPNVFKIFKCELNPLDNKKRNRPLCTFQDIFRTFHDNFQVKLFPPKIILF